MSDEETHPTHAERARTLVASRADGALATLARDPAGHPFASHVLYAVIAGRPVFLLSGLAEHTRNLEADPRASLLVIEARPGDEVLALGRVTLLGTCVRVDRAGVEHAFLARHPDAQRYAAFADFSYWALEVESVRYVGGFGRMSWIDQATWHSAAPDPLHELAAGILAHMNEDHADACLAYAHALAGVTDAQAARMIAIDRYGFDLRVTVGNEQTEVRVPFAAPLTDPQRVRALLVEMVRDARAQLA